MSYVNQASLLAMAVAFMNIGTLLVIARFYIRRMQKMRQGIDDWFLIPALVLMIAMCINMITAVAYDRMGTRTTHPRVDADGKVDPSWGWSQMTAQHEQFVFAQEIIFPVQVACAKLSVLFFYRRVLCPDTRGFFHWATLIAIICSVLFGVVWFLAFVFDCGSDFSLIWNGPMAINAKKCLGLHIEAGCAISDFMLDVIILLLPLRRIFTLHMPTGKKFLVATAFALAGLTVTASFIRGLILEGLVKGVSADFEQTDEIMINSIALYWGLLESGLSVVVACLPSLQYLFVVALPASIAKSFGDSKASSSGGRSGFSGRPGVGGGSSVKMGKPKNMIKHPYGSLDDTLGSVDEKELGYRSREQSLV